MKPNLSSMRLTVLTALLVAAVALMMASAEAADDRKSAESAGMPRLSDGHPNFSGVWVLDAPPLIQNRRQPNGTIPCVVGCPGAPPLASNEGPDDGAAAARPALRAPQRPKYK